MFKYPWTNLHELNLDWLVQQVRDGLVDHGCVFIRPEDFPDSENPIQDALDTASSQNKMVLLSGAYTTRETLSPPAGSVIIGVHDATISTVRDVGIGFAPVTIMDCASHMYIYGVTFDGNRPEGESQSTYPSEHPGELVMINPLVKVWEDVNDVMFDRCSWVHYDSNRSTASTSALFAALGCYQASDIYLHRCSFYDIRQECTVFQTCARVTIRDTVFDCGDDVGHTYSDIGIGETDDVLIDGCTIRHGEHLTTSAINANGNNITIRDCDISAPFSKYGIDYGDESGGSDDKDGLTIQGNKIACHIAAAGRVGYHDHINIINNTFLLDSITDTTQQGVVMFFAKSGQHMAIKDNVFTGTLDGVTYPSHCISLNYQDGYIDIADNIFETFALRVAGNAAGCTIKGNVFMGVAIRITQNATSSQTITMIGCRCYMQIGTAVSDNNTFSFVAIGCDLASNVFTYTTKDLSLSYLRT